MHKIPMRIKLALSTIVLATSSSITHGETSFSDAQLISDIASGVTDIKSADIDGDGDQDIVAALGTKDKIVWYQNTGSGTFGIQRIISTATDNP